MLSLTTGADIQTANTFIGGLVDNTAGVTTTTLSAIDQLTGATGTTNSLSVTTNAAVAANAINGALISNVQTINVRALLTGGAITTLDASQDIGLLHVNSNLSTGALTVSNLATGATVGMIGNASVVTNAIIAGYTAAATGVSTLNVSGGTLGGAVTITGTGITSTVINSTGAANIIGGLTNSATSKSITINAATGITIGTLLTGTDTTITVTGAAATAATPLVPAVNDITSAVQIGTLTAAVTTIDASAMTAGGVGVTLIAGITSFLGGAGNDTVTTAALTSTLPSIIDARGGTGDVLRAGAYAHINTATLAKQYANFEILDGMALTGTAIDMSLFTNSTITGIRAGAGAAESFSNVTATQAANVTIYGNEATSTTFAIVGATTPGQIDTLKLTFDDGLVAKSTYTLASLVSAGTEIINIVANDNATITLMTGAAAWTNSTITGDGNVSITTGALAANANTTINAGALTGTFTFVGTSTTANGYHVTGSATKVDTLTGTTLADILIGGTANDTFNVSVTTSGNDILTGGGGNDTFAFAAAALGAVPSATNFVTITDYVKAPGVNFDTISATALILGVQTAVAGAGVATITGGVATFNAADTTFAQHLTAVEAAIQQTAAGATAIWQEGANSYVFIQTAGAGVSAGDMLIQLTGVTAGALTVSGNAITAMA